MEGMMSKMVRDYLEIRGCDTLDLLIDRLIKARNGLADPATAKVAMKGDDVFGRRLSISYMRPQTAEEAESDARYADAYLESLLWKLSRLEEEVGVRRTLAGGRIRRIPVAA
jgi:hypothetical protein